MLRCTLRLSLIALFGSQALLVIPVECDVVTLIEQRCSECSQRGTVMAMIGLG